MLIPQFTILYVANPTHSALFYRELFGREPVEESPTFAMFVFESGARLALWSSTTVEPAVTQSAGAKELAFSLPDETSVDYGLSEWQARGLTIIQQWSLAIPAWLLIPMAIACDSTAWHQN